MGECEHLAAAGRAGAAAGGCAKCEKEGLPWVALRVCVECGHVGCCDSSVGRHAAKHFAETGHPVMEAAPDGRWRWCYAHEEYG